MRSFFILLFISFVISNKIYSQDKLNRENNSVLKLQFRKSTKFNTTKIFLPTPLVFSERSERHQRQNSSLVGAPRFALEHQQGRENDLFKKTYLRKDKAQTTASTLPIAIGVASFLYLFNPIILFENDKIALGFTKEVSVGFGYFGEHRIFTEYSYIFRKDLNSNIRFGYEYDILLKPGMQPSNLLQGTPALSFGGGYFNNFTRSGYFAQTTFGYSIRNDKFLFYPSLKLRFTYVAKGSNVYDFSFGIIIGIANPFIDLKIKNKHGYDSNN